MGSLFQFYEDFGDIESLVADYLPPGQSDQSSRTNVAAASLVNAFPKSSADVLHVKAAASSLPNKNNMLSGGIASGEMMGGGTSDDAGLASGLDDSDNETNPANEPTDDLLHILNNM